MNAKQAITTAVIVLAVLVLWTYGPAAGQWVWNHTAVPVAEWIVGDTSAECPTAETQVMDEPEVEAPVITDETATEEQVTAGTDPKTDGPVIDQFGNEGSFPGKVVGPAIAEVYNPETGYCALVKVNEGETLDWQHSGAWWHSASQAALNARWPHHRDEYFNQYPKCSAVESAEDVKQ